MKRWLPDGSKTTREARLPVEGHPYEPGRDGSRMTWWQTLIVTITPVLLTLIITNVAESRRRAQDAKQRAEDRAADERAREVARRAQIEDHWRDERLVRFTELLNVVRRIDGHASAAIRYLGLSGGTLNGWDQEFDSSGLKEISALLSAAEGELPSAISAAAIIASPKFYHDALIPLESMGPTLRHAWNQVPWYEQGPSWHFPAVRQAQEMAKTSTQAHTALVNQIRSEMTE